MEGGLEARRLWREIRLVLEYVGGLQEQKSGRGAGRVGARRTRAWMRVLRRGSGHGWGSEGCSGK